jgi:L-ascorbate metabolism protein UlaG (beta-lactamase superfamily)
MSSSLSSSSPISLSVTYFNTAMILLEIGNIRILTDPVFDPCGSEYHLGPIELKKLDEPAVKLEEFSSKFGPVDFILLSHDQHSDNLDAGGRSFLTEAKQVFTHSEGGIRLRETGNSNARGLANWESIMLDSAIGLELIALPAQHGPDGTAEATGPVIGFLLKCPHFSIYLSGDTVPFSGTEEIVEKFKGKIDFAFFNLGAVQLAPMGNLFFSLSANQAAEMAERMEVKTFIPLHFDGWAHFSEKSETARAVLKSSKISEKVHWLVQGEKTKLF